MEAGTPLEYLDINSMSLELIERSASRFLVAWGPRRFTVDLEKGRIDFQEASYVVGSVRCSQSGTVWPATGGEAP